MKLRTKLHKTLLVSLAGLLSAALLTACGTTTEADSLVDWVSTPERSVPVNITPVRLSSISSELSFAGQVDAADHIAVMSRTPGMVDQVFVNVGDFVNAGDVLFTMDPVDIENNINSLVAQLATADAAVNAARTGVAQAGGSAVQQQILQATGGVAQAETALIQAETNVEQSALSLSQAQIAYDTARQSYNDTRSLFSAGVATRIQMDQVEMSLSNAQITLDQAVNNTSLAEAALTQAQTSLQQALDSQHLVTADIPAETRQRAQDGLAQAIAQRNSIAVNLQAARERLDDAAITSPISGIIASRNIEPQTMLGQGTAPFTVVSADSVRVNVEVTEAIIASIEAGQNVTVYITAAYQAPFIGIVSFASPAANPMTSTFTVEVSVDNRDGLIRPGMFAEVFFTRAQAENAVVVPRSAVLTEDGQMVVYLAEGEIAERRIVETGIDNGVEIEVISGLSPGEMLIVTGQTFVTDGVHLQIIDTGSIDTELMDTESEGGDV